MFIRFGAKMDIYTNSIEGVKRNYIQQSRNKSAHSFYIDYQNAEKKHQKSLDGHLETIFKKASKAYSVPETLLKAVAFCESGFRANAVSSAGAMGVMQLMPATAKGLGVKNPMNPEENIMGGAKLISGLLKKYGNNIDLALAGYNAGTGNVAKYGGIPPFRETQNYIKKIKSMLNDSDIQNLSTKENKDHRVETTTVEPYFSQSEIYQELFRIMVQQIRLQNMICANNLFNDSNVTSKEWL